MRQLKLSNCDDYALVDDDDYPVMARFTWHRCPQGYAKTGVSVGRKWHTVSMHRLIMGLQAKDVDHIDRNKLNNQKRNLRFVCRSKNMQNSKRKDNTSGFVGVYVGVKVMSRTRKVKSPSKPYVANIRFKGKSHYLGTYGTAEEAARAYDLKALELYGEFCLLNFPDSKEKFWLSQKR